MFAYDPEKSAANQLKHGISFDEARALWADPCRLDVPARTEDEARFITIGKIGTVHWSAVWCRRGGWIRIISVRRARRKEIEAYEGA